MEPFTSDEVDDLAPKWLPAFETSTKFTEIIIAWQSVDCQVFWT